MCRIVLFVLMIFPACLSAEPKSLEEYYQDLRSGCKTDADCVVKDIGNCCGKSPGCVLGQSTPNPQWVSKFCQEQGIASICGFPMITGCKCEQASCKDILQSAAGVETPILIQ